MSVQSFLQIRAVTNVYQDLSDFVDGRDGLPGWIKDLTDPNAQNLMLRSIESVQTLGIENVEVVHERVVKKKSSKIK
jgi:hypothetical protein